MPDCVIIDQSTYDEAYGLANATLEKFANTKGHYNNTLNSHLRGKIGELACAEWMANNQIKCTQVFRDIEQIADVDLVTSTMRLDVKTWDERYWDDLGRCIAVRQLPKLQKKADAVLWCVTPQKLSPGIAVKIIGWNTIDDVAAAPQRSTGPTGRRQVDNHQVDLLSVRPLEELLLILST